MADQIDTGGPVFPVLLPDPDFPATPGYGQAHKQHPGMTLLDYFSGLAMPLVMARMRDSLTADLGDEWRWNPGFDELISEAAFDLAEAMLAERKKRYG